MSSDEDGPPQYDSDDEDHVRSKISNRDSTDFAGTAQDTHDHEKEGED